MAFTDRTKIVIGDDGLAKLASAKVAVYGLGGVGAACAMDLVRAGVGFIHVVDFDTVSSSNLNRLCIGFSSTIGIPKVEAFEKLAKQINPDVSVIGSRAFFSGEAAASIVDWSCNIHADCIDALNPKVHLLAALCAGNAVFISSMGTAGRMAPERLKLGGIRKTAGCPLARSVKTRLKHLGVTRDFPVVWSDEPPAKPVEPIIETDKDPFPVTGRVRMTQGSAPFVPQTAGHFLASWIVRQLLEPRTIQ